jgi:hypothetical protein
MRQLKLNRNETYGVGLNDTLKNIYSLSSICQKIGRLKFLN